MGGERVFRLNDEAVALLRKFGVSQRTREQLRHLPWDRELSETQLEEGLNQQMPQLGATALSLIVEAGTIAACYAEARSSGGAVTDLRRRKAVQTGD
jgi:hypothetical protein